MELWSVLTGVAILVVSLILLTCGLRLCGRRHNFRVQLFSLVFFSVSIIGSFYFIFGETIALYLVSGFALGIGFALRPIFSKILSGAIFDATHIYNATEVIVDKQIRGKIVQVGLLHTWLQDGDKIWMLGNKYLEEHPVELQLSKKQMSNLRLKTSNVSLLKGGQTQGEENQNTVLKFV